MLKTSWFWFCKIWFLWPTAAPKLHHEWADLHMQKSLELPFTDQKQKTDSSLWSSSSFWKAPYNKELAPTQRFESMRRVSSRNTLLANKQWSSPARCLPSRCCLYLSHTRANAPGDWGSFQHSALDWACPAGTPLSPSKATQGLQMRLWEEKMRAS